MTLTLLSFIAFKALSHLSLHSPNTLRLFFEGINLWLTTSDLFKVWHMPGAMLTVSKYLLHLSVSVAGSQSPVDYPGSQIG